MSFSRVDKLVREVVRTDTLEAASSRREVPLELALPPHEGPNTQLMAQVALALALRCATGPIRIRTSGHQHADLLDRLDAQVEGFGMGQVLERVTSRSTDAVLCLGYEEHDAIVVDANGWRAGINQMVGSEGVAATPALLFAVCASFAKLFAAKVLGRATVTTEKWAFSLWELSEIFDAQKEPNAIRPIDLGNVAILGAGAIGSGLGLALRESPWRGDILFIDSDTYEYPNHETTITMGLQEVYARPQKAPALAHKTQRTRLSTTSLVERISSGHAEVKASRTAFVCAVDNEDTRRAIDDCGADVLLNAAVGGSREDAGHVMWSVHKRDDGQRLSSLYPERAAQGLVPSEIGPTDVDVCSRIIYDSVSLAAPFLGVAAGALLAASLGRHALGEDLPRTYLKLDLFGRQAKYLAR